MTVKRKVTRPLLTTDFVMPANRLFLIFIFCLITLVARTEGVSAQTPEQEVVHLEQMLVDLNERILVEYVLHNDTALLEATARDDFFLIGPAGIESRERVIATVGNLDVDSVTVKNTEIRLYGQSVASSAVLAGTLKANGNLGGRPLPVLSYLSVYIRDGDEWLLAARSLTPLMFGPQGHQ